MGSGVWKTAFCIFLGVGLLVFVVRRHQIRSCRLDMCIWHHDITSFYVFHLHVTRTLHDMLFGCDISNLWIRIGNILTLTRAQAEIELKAISLRDSEGAKASWIKGAKASCASEHQARRKDDHQNATWLLQRTWSNCLKDVLLSWNIVYVYFW